MKNTTAGHLTRADPKPGRISHRSDRTHLENPTKSRCTPEPRTVQRFAEGFPNGPVRRRITRREYARASNGIVAKLLRRHPHMFEDVVVLRC